MHISVAHCVPGERSDVAGRRHLYVAHHGHRRRVQNMRRDVLPAGHQRTFSFVGRLQESRRRGLAGHRQQGEK